MSKKSTENNYAFIDSQNLYMGTQHENWVLDYGKFRLYLRNKYHVRKAFLFIGYVESNANLYRKLQELGYILIFKNVLEIKKEGKVTYKGNVDAELVLHAVIEKPNYDKAVIVSGDGDFRCLVEHLHDEDKLLKIVAPNKKYSSLLKKYAKYIVMLGNMKEKLRRKI